MWCSVGVMLLSRAQHNLANIYDPIKNKLASVNKINLPKDLPYQYGTCWWWWWCCHEKLNIAVVEFMMTAALFPKKVCSVVTGA